MKGRTKLPDWFRDRPSIPDNGDFYLTAFRLLNTSRPTGFGLGPIPWDKIVLYASIKQLDPVMTDVFVDVVVEMDVGFREWNAANPPEPPPTTSTPTATAAKKTRRTGARNG